MGHIAYGADIPEEYCCPISGDIMLEPVTTPRGHSYEKEMILKWVREKGTSPMTRASVNESQIIPNFSLKEAIANHPEALKIRSLSTQIEKALKEKQAIIEYARGKSIVVLIGITGVGKSALGNILASKSFDINNRKLSFADGFKTGDNASVTRWPEYLESSLGLIFDLPGFNDTEGTAQDIINAALIGALFKAAQSIKVVNLVSDSLLGSAERTENLAKWYKLIKFLPEKLIKESTVLLVARSNTMDNYTEDEEYLSDMVAPRTITHADDSDDVQKAKKTLEHLLQKKKILRSPETKKEDASAFLARNDWFKKLVMHIQSLDSLRMPLNWKIQIDLNSTISSVLRYLLKNTIKTIYTTEKNSWPQIQADKSFISRVWSSTNDSLFSREKYLKKLNDAIENNKSIAYIKDFAQESFDAAKKEIEKEFEKDCIARDKELQEKQNKDIDANIEAISSGVGTLAAAVVPGGDKAAAMAGRAGSRVAVKVIGKVAVGVGVKKLFSSLSKGLSGNKK